jgi:two-component system sensor histidine kinase CpxA
VVILALLWLARLQFGSLDNWLLPESSRNQIQAMTVVLADNLAGTPRANWGKVLTRYSAAYQMDFALFDNRAQRVAGAELDPPARVASAMTFPASPGQAAPQTPGMMPPPWAPPGINPGVSESTGDRSTLGTAATASAATVPDFPKSVMQTEEPNAYWLLVRLPPELVPGGPLTLAGRVPSLGVSPLLVNPRPWFIAGGALVVFSILFWLPFARDLTGAIAQMMRATEGIAEGRFDTRVTESRRDELGRLGHAINRMAERLKEFVTGQKRFLGDAAHELCSPLARMEIALGILEERCDEQTRPHVRDVREEVTHMRRLADELLNFSKASLAGNKVKLEAVELAPIVAEAVRLEKREGSLIETRVPEGLCVRAPRDLLLRAVANLLRNAIRYAGAAGPITVQAEQEARDVVLTVADAGPGVPTEKVDKLFEPFYRVDQSRTSATGGMGLGLAIVKGCMDICGGACGAENRTPHGLAVWLRLQAA